MTIPQVSEFMTPKPITIGADTSMAKANQIMVENRIRHLPVLEAGKLIGILSDRDLRLVESFHDVDPEKVSVREACTEEPYTVTPETPLDEVCLEMANHRYGSALVVSDKKLVGIFTWIDGLSAMGKLMEH